MSYNTQNIKAGKKMSKVMSHLIEHGRITHIEAMDLYGMYRLADAIHKLRKRGWEIDTETKKSQTGSAYAVYVLTNQQSAGVQSGTSN